MPDLSIQISESALGDIHAIAKQHADTPAQAPPSVEEMAGCLLEAYLILIRDCGHILPDEPQHTPRQPGVSLGQGVGRMPLCVAAAKGGA